MVEETEYKKRRKMLTRCCGMRLNTAGMVLGWLGCVGSLISIAVLSLGLANAGEIAKWLIKRIKENNPNVDIDEDTVLRVFNIVMVIYLVLTAINLITSSLLILGTVKERHLLLVPWLINGGIALVYIGIYYISITALQISQGIPAGPIIMSVLLSGLSFAFQFYIWYTIYSLFKQLQASREQQLLPRTTATSYPSYTKI